MSANYVTPSCKVQIGSPTVLVIGSERYTVHTIHVDDVDVKMVSEDMLELTPKNGQALVVNVVGTSVQICQNKGLVSGDSPVELDPLDLMRRTTVRLTTLVEELTSRVKDLASRIEARGGEGAHFDPKWTGLVPFELRGPPNLESRHQAWTMNVQVPAKIERLYIPLEVARDYEVASIRIGCVESMMPSSEAIPARAYAQIGGAGLMDSIVVPGMSCSVQVRRTCERYLDTMPRPTAVLYGRVLREGSR